MWSGSINKFLGWPFILCLAMQNKLNTLDRLLRWGVISCDSCILCNCSSPESHNHVFFECSFSKALWAAMLRNQVGRDPLCWDEEEEWFIQHSKGKGFRKSKLKLPLSATTYNIWGKRNLRTFQQKSLDTDSLTFKKKLCYAIREIVMAWRNINANSDNTSKCSLWNVPHCIFKASPL